MHKALKLARRGVAALSCAALLFGCSVPDAFSGRDPLNNNEHLRLGIAYERKGEWTLAMREYTLATQTDPLGNFYMGNLLFQQNKLEAAEQEYRIALRSMRTDPALLNNLAWLLYTRKENLEEAEELAALAIKLAGPEHFADYWDTLEQIRQLKDEQAAPAAAAQPR